MPQNYPKRHDKWSSFESQWQQLLYGGFYSHKNPININISTQIPQLGSADYHISPYYNSHNSATQIKYEKIQISANNLNGRQLYLRLDNHKNIKVLYTGPMKQKWGIDYRRFGGVESFYKPGTFKFWTGIKSNYKQNHSLNTKLRLSFPDGGFISLWNKYRYVKSNFAFDFLMMNGWNRLTNDVSHYKPRISYTHGKNVYSVEAEHKNKNKGDRYSIDKEYLLGAGIYVPLFEDVNLGLAVNYTFGNPENYSLNCGIQKNMENSQLKMKIRKNYGDNFSMGVLYRTLSPYLMTVGASFNTCYSKKTIDNFGFSLSLNS